MNKYIAVIILALSIPLNSFGWKPDFSLNRNSYNVSLLLGRTALGTEQAGMAIGFDISIWGVTVEYLGYGPAHRTVEEERQWNDREAFSLDFGYRIPVLNFLSVYPLIGFSERSSGVTDGTNYRYDFDSDDLSYTRRNKYTKDFQSYSFNFGVGLSVQPFRWLTLHAVATMNAIYGGIGLNLESL